MGRKEVVKDPISEKEEVDQDELKKEAAIKNSFSVLQTPAKKQHVAQQLEN